MDLFQVKLFKEWSAKWPEDNKIKLKEKICEIDTAFGEKLNQEILNGFSNGNGTSRLSYLLIALIKFKGFLIAFNEILINTDQMNYIQTMKMIFFSKRLNYEYS